MLRRATALKRIYDRQRVQNAKGKNQNNEHEKDYRERTFKISEKIIIGKILKSGFPERKIPSRQIKRISYSKSGQFVQQFKDNKT